MYLLLYKQFVNGVPFDLKEYAKIALWAIKSVLKGVHPHTPTNNFYWSTSLPTIFCFSLASGTSPYDCKKQYMSLIECLNELRSLINQVPKISRHEAELYLRVSLKKCKMSGPYQKIDRDGFLL